ncbi:MAG: 3-keto-5-aminohexanoate cleavage protein, partial [Planctomycetota bacterium]
MFSEIAPRYDFLNRFLSFGIDRRWRRRLLRELNPQPGEAVLDLCCGTGDLALAFQARGCAVTGAVHTPSMSPHLPLTPDQIASEAIGAAEAGASILHLHARDPEDGRPSPDPDLYMQFLPRIKQSTNAVVNIT